MKIKKEYIILFIGSILILLRLLFNMVDSAFFAKMFFIQEIAESEYYEFWNTTFQVLGIGIATFVLYYLAENKKI
ncbi:hypothetical protein ACFL5G_02345 [Candidatus Margulisiibacteriota bacterium]